MRDEEYVGYVCSTFKDPQQSVPMREIGEGLFAILAFVSPDAIGLANAEGIAKTGLSQAEARDLAMRQTKAILPTMPRDDLIERQAVAFREHEYPAGLLADTQAWTEISGQAGPDLFVTAVSDGFVFVGFMPDGPELEKFKQTVLEDCKAQTRCVSPFVYRFKQGRWIIAK